MKKGTAVNDILMYSTRGQGKSKVAEKFIKNING